MFSNFFKTYKSTLIKLILIVLFVSIVVEYINKYKRKLFGKLSVIERKLDHIQSRTLENNFIQTGYKIDNLVNFRERLESSFFFVGHIHPRSEYVNSIDTKYRNETRRKLLILQQEDVRGQMALSVSNNPNKQPLKR